MEKLTRRSFLKISATAITIAAFPAIAMPKATGVVEELLPAQEVVVPQRFWSVRVGPGRYSMNCLVGNDSNSLRHVAKQFVVERRQTVSVCLDKIRDGNLYFSNLTLERLDYGLPSGVKRHTQRTGRVFARYRPR